MSLALIQFAGVFFSLSKVRGSLWCAQSSEHLTKKHHPFLLQDLQFSTRTPQTLGQADKEEKVILQLQGKLIQLSGLKFPLAWQHFLRCLVYNSKCPYLQTVWDTDYSAYLWKTKGKTPIIKSPIAVPWTSAMDHNKSLLLLSARVLFSSHWVFGGHEPQAGVPQAWWMLISWATDTSTCMELTTKQ